MHTIIYSELPFMRSFSVFKKLSYICLCITVKNHTHYKSYTSYILIQFFIMYYRLIRQYSQLSIKEFKFSNPENYEEIG